MDDQNLTAKVDSAIEKLKGLNEREIYYEVSRQQVERIKKQAISSALASLSPAERSAAERDMNSKEGIYGPISGLLSHVKEPSEHEVLYGIGKLRPTPENGEVLVKRILEQLKGLLCDDWHYCEKRKEYKDDLKLVATAAAIGVKTLSLEIGIVTAAILVAVYKGPDFFCNCSQREMDQSKEAKS